MVFLVYFQALVALLSLYFYIEVLVGSFSHIHAEYEVETERDRFSRFQNEQKKFA